MTMPADNEGFFAILDHDLSPDDPDFDEFSIDVDSFFDILNEEQHNHHNSHHFPTEQFCPSTDNSLERASANNIDNGAYDAVRENVGQALEGSEQVPCTSPAEMMLSVDNGPLFQKSSTESHVCQLPNLGGANYFQSTHDCFSELNVSTGFNHRYLFNGASYESIMTNGHMNNNIEGHVESICHSHSLLENNISLETEAEDANMTASQVPTYDFFSREQSEAVLNGRQSVNTYDSNSTTTSDEASAESFVRGLMGNLCEKQADDLMDEKNNEISEGFECKFSEANEEGTVQGFPFASGPGRFLTSAEVRYSSGVTAAASYHIPPPDRKPTNLQLLGRSFSSPMAVASFEGSFIKKEEGNYTMAQFVKSDREKEVLKESRASLAEGGNEEEEDDDICIIEDMNQSKQFYASSTHRKSLVPVQRSTFTPHCSAVVAPSHMGVSGGRHKATDERHILQVLVQDLSQPKSESTPPDGVLAVPLLRHQRIALSWMMQKETNSLQCSGGILADDQGLGKTVSTIALILTEKPPSSTTSKKNDLLELETLDLDDGVDSQTRHSVSVDAFGTSSSRGRPSGGTLIVCPTSVLRQWAEELRTKVTSKVDLSVLVYHGSNRTKDPYELAKFDVVLTTYSIVSAEVPKQPVVVKGCNDKQKPDANDAPFPTNKKRKHSSSFDKKVLNRGVNNELVESDGRPLARVRWFRVVLDEAQSIKNFRTQVAQACWGLRAKRRWCLSGTPLQNAVDDLYSYFRFLKYDPYSVYNSFCSMVKIPISKDPSSGYRKLQAVLRTIMLRRTKGTLLDGKPIITLPPKSIKLMKVEFSEEERDFYSRLEADSRAKFQAYAESGTVKQNYVNILLLLLRLRQACDHPLLVRGFDSASVLKSSIHAAQGLSEEQQIFLLNCLETSLAICHICNDPPEDAVVGMCGHVFCNQCICERLSGDDYQCPATKCKDLLRGTSVFSKDTLRSCLSKYSCQYDSCMDSASESSDQRVLVGPQPFGHGDSSKLKAALEVLQSLSKPQVYISDNTSEEPIVHNDNLAEPNMMSSAPNVQRNSDAMEGIGGIKSVVKEKAIVFSQWTRMLDLLEACLKESSIEYRRLDGTMSVVARDKAVKDFNTLPEVTVMIMSLKAASLGLNMVAACHVLLLDLWWNPTTEDQAIDRAHRIGQTRPVTVVRLTVKDTVEDRILALQQKKRELVASAFGEDETGSRQTRLTVDDLKYLFMA